MNTGQAPIFEQIDRYVDWYLLATGGPGVAMAVTDDQELLHLSTAGFADVAAQRAVAASDLFEIGSIGKSFTSVLVLQLVEEGLLDLHAPVTEYLPWFSVRSAFAPITIHHVLSHTAGLVRGPEFSPGGAGAVWALRDTEIRCLPGLHFHYSNHGYKLLGLILSEVLGESYGELLRRRILTPLAMNDTEPVISHSLRARLAVGHQPLFDDRLYRFGDPLIPATWFEGDTADGSISATAADLASFLRMLLNQGKSPSGRLLSATAFDLMTKPASVDPDASPGSTYGYGIASRMSDGRRTVWHDGGMVGYAATMLGDLDARLGVVVLTNGPGKPRLIAEFALAAMRASRAQTALPAVPAVAAVTDPSAVAQAAARAGVYRSVDDERSLIVKNDRVQLFLSLGAEWHALDPAGSDLFLARDGGEATAPFVFRRDDGEVVEVVHGCRRYVRAGRKGLGPDEYPADWHAFAGHYRSHDPWLTNFRVLPGPGGLQLLVPNGQESPLSPLGERTFRIGADPCSPETIRFDAIVAGQALRANLSGGDYYRFFTP